MAKGRRGKRGKRGGKKPLPIRAFSPKIDVWKAQKVLRDAGYFARAVGPNKMVTTAPQSVTKGK